MITLGRAAFQSQGRTDEYYGMSAADKLTEGEYQELLAMVQEQEKKH